jgi:putative two-component system response regulator
MTGCDPTQVQAMLQGVIESSLAYCGYYKSPARMQELGRLLAELAGESRERAATIGLACSLCDLGMIGMPHEVLGRDGPLSPTEREVLQQHTLVGEELLGAIEHPQFQVAARVAACHHERMDGGGYPRGLVGEAIPLEARVAAVVSIYVALTQPRPFRKLRSHEDALALLDDLRGSHLDHHLVNLVLANHDHFRVRL